MSDSDGNFARHGESSSDRFNLLLLEDGEYYFTDFECYYHPTKKGHRWDPHRRATSKCDTPSTADGCCLLRQSISPLNEFLFPYAKSLSTPCWLRD